MAKPVDVVRRFAEWLDAENYALTKTCLSIDCIYEAPEGCLTGPDEIIASYRGNGDKAADLFDSVVYSHEVTTEEGGWFQILFVDELSRGSRSHTFRCHQRVHVDGSQIARIVHVEIPGERDALTAFQASLLS